MLAFKIGTLLAIVHIHVYLSVHAQTRSKPLYIAGLYPDENSGWTAPLIKVIADLAVEYIHNTTNILPDYKIIIDWRNSECRMRAGIREFIEFTKNETVYKAVFGPACTISTAPVAEIAPSYNLNILSYSATSPSLTDSASFPTLTLGSPNFIKSMIIWISIIRQNKWRRVANLYSNNLLFIRVGEMIQENLVNLGITANTERIDGNNDREVYKQEITRKLEKLFKDEKYRIAIGNFYEGTARDVLCIAYRMGFTYPRVTWLLPGWYTPNWFNGDSLGDCNGDEIKEASKGALGNDGLPSRDQLRNGSTNTIFNVLPREIDKKFIDKSRALYGQRMMDVDTNTSYEFYTFDSMVTLALALNELENIYSGSIDIFNYKNESIEDQNEDISSKLDELIQNVTFNGLTGEVRYFDRSRYDKRGQIFEIVEGNYKLIHLLYDIPSDNNFENYKEFNGFDSQKLTYFDKQAEKPLDGVLLYHLPIWLYVIMLFLMVLCISYVISFIVVHIVYNNKKVFRLSSPSINFLILIGCLIQVFAVVPYLFDNLIYKRIPEEKGSCWYCTMMCHLRYLLNSIAKDLIFGSLICKSFRLYIIAVKKSIGVTIHDWKLFLVIIILVLIDIVFNLTWAAIPAINLQYITKGITVNDVGFGNDENAPFRIIYDCVAGGNVNSHARWVPIIYLLLRSIIYIIGIFLAFKIRKVKIRGVNEFVAIAYTTLVTIMFTFFRIFLNVVIFDWYDFALSLICFSFLLDTILVVSFLFIPKLYFVIRDPKECRIYTNMPIIETVINSTFDNMKKQSLTREIETLEKRRESLIKEVHLPATVDEVEVSITPDAN